MTAVGLAVLFSTCLSEITCDSSIIEMEAFDTESIPHDMHIKKPASLLKVKYGSIDVVPGIVLTPTQVKDQPIVSWNADAHDFYTLVMNDPDAPSRADPKFREWQHWCVVNIPGADLSRGEALSEYVGSGPPKGTNQHRYVLLLFKQSGLLTFDERRLTNRSGEGRGKQHVAKFAEKYNLGDPVAGNFFKAEWDDYVPHLFEPRTGK